VVDGNFLTHSRHPGQGNLTSAMAELQTPIPSTHMNGIAVLLPDRLDDRFRLRYAHFGCPAVASSPLRMPRH
jgi:hypothetical protein